MSVPSISISSFSSLGARLIQEDLVWMNRSAGVFVVADGFGGGAGAYAAQLVCDRVGAFLSTQSRDEEATLPHVFHSYYSLAANVLFNALVHANQGLKKWNQARTLLTRGGTSALAAYLDEGHLSLGNVGCCSAWLFRQGRMKELVVPRDYARLRDPLDASQEFSAPLMALGVDEDLEPEIVEVRLQAGDWVLLHTDGIRPKHRDWIFSFQDQGLPGDEASSQILAGLQGEAFRDNASFLLLIAS